jgi:Domain of unknown function (DUF4136)
MCRPYLAAILLLGATFACAQDAKTDYDHSFDFTQLHSFAVQIASHWGNPETEKRAEQRVIDTLTKKGWKQADEASADALVMLHGTTNGKQTFRSFYDKLPAYSYHMVGAPALPDSDGYEPGVLVIDVFDAKTKQVVFRGVGYDSFSRHLQDSDKKTDKAVKKIMKKVPTEHKGEEHGG